MEKIKVFGGRKLFGSIDICSSKNALLPILAGSILSSGEVTLVDVPKFSDIFKMCAILQSLGAGIVYYGKNISINSKIIDKYVISHQLGKDIRSSIVMLGALLSRFKTAVVSYPGGCNIGSRPIDLHIKGLERLGVKITESHGYLFCDGKEMKSGVVNFEKQSVGATQNLILASIFLDGKTTLTNCAKEPEIKDLANFLNSMGADIIGAGTNKIEIRGVKSLNGTTYRAIGDRIVAGTYLCATAIVGGKVTICNILPEYLTPVTKKLAVCGCNISIKSDNITISANGRCNALKSITTGTYPKFPTDMQSVFLSLMTVSKGTCKIHEKLFDGRFKQVPDLIKMGAKIEVSCNSATIHGVQMLSGADVVATDLRAGAGLVVAGLNAEGYTTIEDVFHIDRGYDHIECDLQKLGAEIERVD